MDYLNHPLCLDLVVRDSETGNILDPELTSAVALFREHKRSSDNRARHGMAGARDRHSTCMLLLAVKIFT